MSMSDVHSELLEICAASHLLENRTKVINFSFINLFLVVLSYFTKFAQ